MPEVPTTLEEAIASATEATKAAIEEGCKRLQVELLIPEIALESQSLALQFTAVFEDDQAGLKVLFADSGAAALARRDWGETPFKVSDLGSRFTAVDRQVFPEDSAFLVVAPSAIEVKAVEKLCEIAGDRPVVLLIPQMEDVSIVGIGYAGRQLRERFLSTIETCYYFRPLEGAAVLRAYPSLWQVWLEKGDRYELIAQESQKPMGEALETIITKATGVSEENNEAPKPQKAGLLANMQRFLRALSQ